MSDKSGIEWLRDPITRLLGATWNWCTGCKQIPGVQGRPSGCGNCYAKQLLDTRMRANPTSERYGLPFERVLVHWNRFAQPLRWGRPRRIFVNSLSDVFHEDVPDEAIDLSFAVMAITPRHTYQLLTKRPERMRRYLRGLTAERLTVALHRSTQKGGALYGWVDCNGYDCYGDDECAERIAARGGPPYGNVHIGVSVSTNDDGWRVEMQRDVAALGWLVWGSFEPLLGQIDPSHLSGLNWLVVGGESETPARPKAPRARPMHPVWARDIRDTALALGIPYFFKQWGCWQPRMWKHDGATHALAVDGEFLAFDHLPNSIERADGPPEDRRGWQAFAYVGKHEAGRELDGRTWDDYPRIGVAA